jgi:RHS repeat-associated protein
MWGSVASFSYGPDGARISKNLGSSTTRYFAGEELLVDATNPSGLLSSYLAATIKRSGLVTSWTYQDHQGSNRVGTFMSGGAATTQNDYVAYGQPATGADINGKGYINQRYDTETNLQYLNSRYYDSALGLFLSPDALDPTEAGVGTNRYAYSGGESGAIAGERQAVGAVVKPRGGPAKAQGQAVGGEVVFKQEVGGQPFTFHIGVKIRREQA